MLILLDSSVSVSVASEDLGDPTFGFPNPECHRIQWFKPRSVCNQSCTLCTLLRQLLVCPGTRIRLYGFLVPNVFCVPWRRLPESAALESVAGFQPWEGHVVASWESRAAKMCLYPYGHITRKSRTQAIHDNTLPKMISLLNLINSPFFLMFFVKLITLNLSRTACIWPKGSQLKAMCIIEYFPSMLANICFNKTQFTW
jgi:hypothetical protein